MAEPKKRTNNSKQGMRRMHDKVTSNQTTVCEKCNELKKAHTVCYNCGTYRGKQVLETKSEK